MKKNKKVLCVYCKNPIHISKWAGVNKKGMFCDNMFCLTKLIKEGDKPDDSPETKTKDEAGLKRLETEGIPKTQLPQGNKTLDNIQETEEIKSEIKTPSKKSASVPDILFG